MDTDEQSQEILNIIATNLYKYNINYKGIKGNRFQIKYDSPTIWCIKDLFCGFKKKFTFQDTSSGKDFVAVPELLFLDIYQEMIHLSRYSKVTLSKLLHSKFIENVTSIHKDLFGHSLCFNINPNNTTSATTDVVIRMTDNENKIDTFCAVDRYVWGLLCLYILFGTTWNETIDSMYNVPYFFVNLAFKTTHKKILVLKLFTKMTDTTDLTTIQNLKQYVETWTSNTNYGLISPMSLNIPDLVSLYLHNWIIQRCEIDNFTKSIAYNQVKKNKNTHKNVGELFGLKAFDFEKCLKNIDGYENENKALRISRRIISCCVLSIYVYTLLSENGDVYPQILSKIPLECFCEISIAWLKQSQNLYGKTTNIVENNKTSVVSEHNKIKLFIEKTYLNIKDEILTSRLCEIILVYDSIVDVFLEDRQTLALPFVSKYNRRHVWGCVRLLFFEYDITNDNPLYEYANDIFGALINDRIKDVREGNRTFEKVTGLWDTIDNTTDIIASSFFVDNLTCYNSNNIRLISTRKSKNTNKCDFSWVPIIHIAEDVFNNPKNLAKNLYAEQNMELFYEKYLPIANIVKHKQDYTENNNAEIVHIVELPKVSSSDLSILINIVENHININSIKQFQVYPTTSTKLNINRLNYSYYPTSKGSILISSAKEFIILQTILYVKYIEQNTIDFRVMKSSNTWINPDLIAAMLYGVCDFENIVNCHESGIAILRFLCEKPSSKMPITYMVRAPDPSKPDKCTKYLSKSTTCKLITAAIDSDENLLATILTKTDSNATPDGFEFASPIKSKNIPVNNKSQNTKKQNPNNIVPTTKPTKKKRKLEDIDSPVLFTENLNFSNNIKPSHAIIPGTAKIKNMVNTSKKKRKKQKPQQKTSNPSTPDLEPIVESINDSRNCFLLHILTIVSRVGKPWRISKNVLQIQTIKTQYKDLFKIENAENQNTQDLMDLDELHQINTDNPTIQEFIINAVIDYYYAKRKTNSLQNETFGELLSWIEIMSDDGLTSQSIYSPGYAMRPRKEKLTSKTRWDNICTDQYNLYKKWVTHLIQRPELETPTNIPVETKNESYNSISEDSIAALIKISKFVGYVVQFWRSENTLSGRWKYVKNPTTVVCNELAATSETFWNAIKHIPSSKIMLPVAVNTHLNKKKIDSTSGGDFIKPILFFNHHLLVPFKSVGWSDLLRKAPNDIICNVIMSTLDRSNSV